MEFGVSPLGVVQEPVSAARGMPLPSLSLSSDSLSVQRCLVFAVPMLSQQQEFNSDASYLCLPPPPQYSSCLHYAGTRDGRAAEKGMEGKTSF